MSSGTSTDRGARSEGGFEVWHFYVLVSMVAATVAVMLARNTHPAALLLLSAAVVAAGLVGLALHYAMTGFVDPAALRTPLADGEREALVREKALTLRSIKELEFDRAMGKVSAKDFDDLGARLRARAMMLIEELDQFDGRAAAHPGAATGPSADAGPDSAACPTCQTANDVDARFCKQCGARL